MGIDPLISTYKWIERSLYRLINNNTIGSYQISSNLTSLTILNQAYYELLLWNPTYTFPEVYLFIFLFFFKLISFLFFS